MRPSHDAPPRPTRCTRGVAWAIVAMCSVAAAGCADDDQPAQPDASLSLCAGDGSNIELLVRILPNGRANNIAYAVVENGIPALIVSDACQAYAFASSVSYAAQLRTATLSRQEYASLRARLRYGSWSETRGVVPGDPGVYDASTVELSTGEDTIWCTRGCAGGAVPPWLEEAADAAFSYIDELWLRGERVETGARLGLLEFRSPPSYEIPLADWPLDQPIGELSRSDLDAGFGGYPLISDPDDVAALFALQESYAAGDHGTWWYHYVPFRDDDDGGPPEYSLLVRPEFPFEDDDGLVRVPPAE